MSISDRACRMSVKFSVSKPALPNATLTPWPNGAVKPGL